MSSPRSGAPLSGSPHTESASATFGTVPLSIRACRLHPLTGDLLSSGRGRVEPRLTTPDDSCCPSGRRGGRAAATPIGPTPRSPSLGPQGADGVETGRVVRGRSLVVGVPLGIVLGRQLSAPWPRCGSALAGRKARPTASRPPSPCPTSRCRHHSVRSTRSRLPLSTGHLELLPKAAEVPGVEAASATSWWAATRSPPPGPDTTTRT